MIYKPLDIRDNEINRPIWAVAYQIDNETGRVKLRCEPTMGEIRPTGSLHHRYEFRKYHADKKNVCANGVDYRSRIYADTREEAIQAYNECVQQRITKLETMLADAKTDMLPS